ncbi:hypothetical protein J3R83DRAFT_12059 [Lanmaoa asiatica]|nr:hypothetical protein J3R83DRAFT_12059 [Lanmaoa asiatica]
MFKRVERKRKRREEGEELCLDQDTREIMGLNDTDSDESDSGSEHESAQSDDSVADIGEDKDQEEDAASEDEGINEDVPISVTEALKDPIYLISLDPPVHGCVLCKGKLIKNAGMATAHKNANVHKRRFEHFRLLSADADPRSNAWELVRAIRSASKVQRGESKRALKRQVKQAAIREKRKRHKELKAKAMAKKALKKLSTTDETRPTTPSKVNLRSSPVSQRGKTRKKQKLESKTSTGTIMETRDATAKSASRTKTSSNSKKSVLGSRLRSTVKGNKPL